MVDKVECLVVGAGAVGLAIARNLSASGIETFVIDKANTFGTETSSRNSEVIHAGIYYPKNSLKAKLCVEGKNLLYQYCISKDIPHAKTGKIIVANNSSQTNVLRNIEKKANANGVGDLELLNKQQIQEKEPTILAKFGLYSPSSGIIDSHQYMFSLVRDIEKHSSFVVYNTQFVSAYYNNGSWLVNLNDGNEYQIECKYIINCAGLYAVDVANSIKQSNQFTIPSQYYAKGSYFTYHGAHNFKHLVYPVPEPGGLGIHLTMDLDGKIKFGPNVEWVTKLDYRIDEQLKDCFYSAIKQYWPTIEYNRLSPDYTGIRPKTSPPNAPDNDFVIQNTESVGLKGLVNLYGIESPGLTASLAIANYVKRIIISTVN